VKLISSILDDQIDFLISENIIPTSELKTYPIYCRHRPVQLSISSLLTFIRIFLDWVISPPLSAHTGKQMH
jgi:hypothetical protein